MAWKTNHMMVRHSKTSKGSTMNTSRWEVDKSGLYELTHFVSYVVYVTRVGATDAR